MKILKLLLLLIFSAVFNFSNSQIIMQPYLMGVQPNSVWVLMECSTTDTVTVDYGLTASYGSTSRTAVISTTTNNTYVHKVYLNGLDDNSTYYYRARQNASTSSGYNFVTAPASQVDFRFVWIGDYRTGTAVHDQICQLIPQYNPRFYLNGGDVANTGSYNDFKNEFFRQGELNLLSKYPFFLATGNHESWSTNTKAFTKGITVQSGTEDYYSFDYGNMHVLVLNNLVSYSVGSNQYNFAMADLGSTNKTWKIVISHYPGYCSGGHGEDAGMKTLSTNIFVPKGVDMVISGHSHFYQHNRVSGIEHMVLGGGGAPLYNPTNASYTIKSVRDYNFGIGEVTSNSFTLRIYNNLNTLLDTVKLTKNPTGILENESVITDFSLNEIYPNPSNPQFTISYDILKEDTYRLELFDISGRSLNIVSSGNLKPGHYEKQFSSTDLSSGAYFIMLSGSNNFISKKIAVIK